MRLDYKFYFDTTNFKVVMDQKIDILERKYYKTIIYNLGALFLNTNRLGIIVKSNNDNECFLAISCGDKRKVNMIVTPSKIKVMFNKKSYTFLHEMDNNGVILYLEEIVYDEDVKLVETFLSHVVRFKIIIKDRVFLLSVPMDIDYVIDKNIFNSIKYDSSLNDLKKIYDNYLRKIQERVSYDFYKMDTVIGVYDYFNLEEKNSIVKKYRGGEVVFRKASIMLGDIRLEVTINDNNEPLVVIKGYDINSNINIIEEIKNLYQTLGVNETRKRNKIIPFK